MLTKRYARKQLLLFFARVYEQGRRAKLAGVPRFKHPFKHPFKYPFKYGSDIQWQARTYWLMGWSKTHRP